MLQLRSAREIYIPNSKALSNSLISDFRPISLLNVKGKLFFRVISKCLESHVVQNKIINSPVRKVCIEKMHWKGPCWEHLSMVWSVLKEARSNKLSAASIWFHTANTSGSIHYKLKFFALQRYVPSTKCIQIVESYYGGRFRKFFSESATTSWHRHECGIFAGCTISIILFFAGMNEILEYSSHTNVPKFVINSNPLLLIRVFMNDLKLLSSSVSCANTLLYCWT